jgi:Coenzyme PQQ synthesis protein D (PqqD)
MVELRAAVGDAMSAPAERRVIRNPNVVYRVLKEHGPVLFDPDSGRYFGLNETGRIIWLAVQSGDQTVADLVAAVVDAFEDAPPETADDVIEFIDDLVSRGLVVLE